MHVHVLQWLNASNWERKLAGWPSWSSGMQDCGVEGAGGDVRLVSKAQQSAQTAMGRPCVAAGRCSLAAGVQAWAPWRCLPVARTHGGIAIARQVHGGYGVPSAYAAWQTAADAGFSGHARAASKQFDLYTRTETVV